MRPINPGAPAKLILETQLATPKGGRAEAFSLRVWSSLAVVGPAQQFAVAVHLTQVVRARGDQVAVRVHFCGSESGEFKVHVSPAPESVSRIQYAICDQVGKNLITITHEHLGLANGAEQIGSGHDW